jgi:hypothetical protein
MFTIFLTGGMRRPWVPVRGNGFALQRDFLIGKKVQGSFIIASFRSRDFLHFSVTAGGVLD